MLSSATIIAFVLFGFLICLIGAIAWNIRRKTSAIVPSQSMPNVSIAVIDSGIQTRGPDQLVWFELQECPMEFRFAVIPDQPVLFGYKPDAAAPIKTLLLPDAVDPRLVDSIVDSLYSLIRTHGVFETEQQASELTFQKPKLESASLHLRFAYADQRRWQSCFDITSLPANIRMFYDDCRNLGINALGSREGLAIAANQAVAMVKAATQPPPKIDVLARVSVNLRGEIYFDGDAVSLDQLDEKLADLAKRHGGIRYSRENAGKPPASQWAVIERVLQAFTKHRLPVQLVEHNK